jgi:hypothetical protein
MRLQTNFSLLFSFFLALLVACTPATPNTQTITTSSPTETATTPIVTEVTTPLSCEGGFSWAYGTASPEFAQWVETALATAQITGTVKVSTFGENDACGDYHPMSTDYVFVIPVADLTDTVTLSSIGEQIMTIVRAAADQENRPAPNIGNVSIQFQAGEQVCRWQYQNENKWDSDCD